MNRILCFLFMMTCAHAATVSFDNSTKLTSPTDVKLRADTVNSSGTITTAKGIVQTATALSGTVIDWSLSGIRYGSMSADTTYTFSNVTADKSISLYLVANGFQPTFPLASTNWDGGTLPTASASGEDTYIFTYVNGHYHGSFLPAVSSGGGTTLYTGDGTLAGDRVVNANGNDLEFNLSPSISFDGDPTSSNNSGYFGSFTSDGNLSEVEFDAYSNPTSGDVSILFRRNHSGDDSLINFQANNAASDRAEIKVESSAFGAQITIDSATDLFIKTPGVNNSSVIAGQVLTLIDAGTGKADWTNAPIIWTGTTNIGNLATSLVISLGHTMPDTNYVPSISFIGGALAAAITPTFSATTTTEFTLNLSAGITGGSPIRWSVISNP